MGRNSVMACVVHVPVRHVLHTPRCTALTTLGIPAAIAALVATMGFPDSLEATLDKFEQELAGNRTRQGHLLPGCCNR
jgi:hypothetical protein